MSGEIEIQTRNTSELMTPHLKDLGKERQQKTKLFVSIVVAGYNEASNAEKNIQRICDYVKSLEDRYHWEFIFVDDGSTDGTGKLDEIFSKTRDNVRQRVRMA